MRTIETIRMMTTIVWKRWFERRWKIIQFNFQNKKLLRETCAAKKTSHREINQSTTNKNNLLSCFRASAFESVFKNYFLAIIF